MILKRFQPNPSRRSIDELYGAIVAQARSVVFYTAYGIPDTLEGRFDLIVLHMVLLLAALDHEGTPGRGIGQKLFDRFCRDLDASLREMGVATSQFQRECANSARRFMEGRRPISRLCAQLTAGSLRRHWRAISFMERMVMDHAAWGGMRASWRTNLRFMIKAHCCAARLPFPTRRPSPFLNQPCLSPRMSEPPMPESKSRSSAAPWHVPVAVEEVAESGQHFDLVAEAPVRTAVARVAGLRDLPRFEASFDVTRRGAGGLHVVGSISATVGQNCVVTLEPLANDVQETVDLIFEPAETPGELADDDGQESGQQHNVKLDAPEPLIGGVIDLGALAMEFLILGLDPYPRKPGAVFQPPQDSKPEQGPFAAFSRLAKRQDGG